MRAALHFARSLLCTLLALHLLLDPVIANAAGITPDAAASGQRPGVLTAPNGVPIVNITAPNGAGLSHNQFTQFNVGSNGVVLNNSATTGVSKLGGAILGNPNLGGGSASTILAEVTGSSTSLLQGATEVFGPAASFILANSNGITCQGCGFINTPRVTLTTGTPLIDSDGGLRGFSVQQGAVSIDGATLDVTGQDIFDIVSRTATLNAAIKGQQLGIFTGAGQFDYAGRTLTGNGTASSGVSIDSTALGGMYANRITLVGTDKGVGVNLQGEVDAANSLSIGADGQIQVTTLRSGGALGLASASGTVTVPGTVYAGGDLSLGGASAQISGALGTAGAVTITAQSVSNSGSISAGINPSGQVSAGTGALNISGGTIANSGLIQAGQTVGLSSTGAITNTGSATVTTSGTLSATAPRIDNEGTIRAGQGTTLSALNLTNGPQAVLSSQQALIVSGGTISNQGAISAAGILNLSAATSLDNGGTIESDSALTLQGGNVGNSGTIANAADINMALTSLDNSGILAAGEDLTLDTISGTLTNSGHITAPGKAILSGNALANSGTIASNGALNGQFTQITNSGAISAGTTLDLPISGDFSNSGTVVSGGTATLQAQDTRNSGAISSGGSLALSLASLNNATGALLSGTGGLTLTSPAITNLGHIESAADIIVTTPDTLSNSGAIASNHALSITAAGLNNGGTVSAGTTLDLPLSGDFSNTGTIVSGGNTALQAQNASNGGAISSGGSLTLSFIGLNNAAGGQILAGTTLGLTLSDGLINAGALEALGDATLKSGNALANSGTIASNGALNGQFTQITNSGAISAGTTLDLPISGDFSNSGTVVSGGTATLQAQDTRNSGAISSGGSLALSLASLNNATGALLSGTGGLTLTSPAITNLGHIESAADIIVTTPDTLSNSGAIASNHALSITAAGLSNGGTVSAGTTLDLPLSGDFSNTGTIVSGGNTALQAQNASNGGAISSGGSLTLSFIGLNNAAGGQILAGTTLGLTLSDGLINAGALEALGDATLKSGNALANSGTIASNGALNGQFTQITNSGAISAGTTLDLPISGDFSNSGTVVSGGTATLQAQDTRNSGAISSGGSLALSLASLNNATGALLSGTGGLTLTSPAITNLGHIESAADIIVTTPDTLSNSGAIASNHALSITAAGLSNGGTVSAGTTLDLPLSGDFSNTGTIVSGGNTALQAQNASNGGAISSGGSLTLSFIGLNNAAGGQILAGTTLGLTLSDGLINAGALEALGDATLKSGNALANSGTIASNGALNGQFTQITNSGAISAGTTLDLPISGDFSNSGTVVSGGTATLQAQDTRNSGAISSGGSLALSLASLNNATGALLSGTGGLTLTSPAITNLGHIESAADIIVTTPDTLSNSGAIASNHALSITAAGLSNGGTVSAGTTLDLPLSGDFSNTGTIVSGGNTALQAQNASNGGAISSGGSLTLSFIGLNNAAGGQILAGTTLGLTLSDGLINAGALEALGDATLKSGNALANSGTIASNGALNGQFTQITNSGAISAGTTLDLTGSDSFSNSGTVVVGGDTALTLASLNNSAGSLIQAGGALTLDISGTLTNAGGLIAQGPLSTGQASLTNAASGLIQTSGDLTLRNGAIGNDGLITAGAILTGTITSLANTGTISAGTTLGLTVAGAIGNTGRIESLGDAMLQAGAVSNGGVIASNGSLTAALASLDNTSTATLAAAGLDLTLTGPLTNDGSLKSAGPLTLQATTLSNSGTLQSTGGLSATLAGLTNAAGATLDGQGGLTLTLSGGFSNAGSLESGGAFNITAADPSNSGTLASTGLLSLTLADLTNTGTVSGGTGLILTLSGPLLNSGTLVSGGDLALTATSLGNSGGVGISAAGSITGAVGGGLTNQAPLVAGGDLTLTGLTSLSNSDLMLAGGAMRLEVSGAAQNIGGTITSGGALSLTGANGGVAGSLLNQGGDIQTIHGDLTLSANQITNEVLGGNAQSVSQTVYDQTWQDNHSVPLGPCTIGAGCGYIVLWTWVPNPSGGHVVASASDTGAWYASNTTDIAVRSYIVETGTSLSGGQTAAISSGGALSLYAPSGITNLYSTISSAGNMALSGGSLTNVGSQLTDTWYISAYDQTYTRCYGGACSWLGNGGGTAEIGAWTAAQVGGRITAGGSLTGSFTGQIDNVSISQYGTAASNSQAVAGPSGLVSIQSGQISATPASGYSGQINLITGRAVSGNSQVSPISGTAAATTATVSAGQVSPISGSTAATTATVSAGQVSPISGSTAATTATVSAGQVSPISGSTASTASQVAQTAVPSTLAGLQTALAQQLPGFSSRFQAAPASSPVLFETRFQYTDLGTFYGSTYFLRQMGLQGDNTEKSLGDAYMDTELVSQAVIQATGQKYLSASYTSDGQQMQALIDNAAAEAATEHLVVGQALTQTQIAGLKSDIVWYVTEQVDGQSVLVPTLYLANPSAINTSGATLAAAGGIGLSASGLNTSGAITAGTDLTVASSGDIVNSGLIHAGGNASLTASGGNIVDQTATVLVTGAAGNDRTLRVGQAAITAGGALTVKAGGAVTVAGATASAGGPLTITAGGDLTIASNSLQQDLSWQGGGDSETINALNHDSSSVSAGQGLTLTAGRNVTVSGSSLSAGGDASIAAGGGVTLAAVQNSFSEQASSHKGGSFSHSDASTQAREVTSQTATVTAGGNVTVTSGGDLTLQAASVNAGGNIALTSSGGAIKLLADTDSSVLSQTSSHSGALWQSSGQQGHTSTTTVMDSLTAKGGISAKAANGLVIQYSVPANTAMSMQAALDQLAKTPQTAWVEKLATTNPVAWQAIQNQYQSWSQHQSGLTGTAQALIAIAMAVVTMGAGLAADATALAGEAGMGAASSTVGAMAVAGASTIASNMVINSIDNGGNLGAALGQTFSGSDLTSLGISMATAGISQGIGGSSAFQSLLPTGNDFVSLTERAALQQGVSAVANTAGGVLSGRGLGSSLTSSLLSAGIATAGQVGANEIGQAYIQGNLGTGTLGDVTHILAHAALGCAEGAAAGGGCGAGATGGAVGELAAQTADNVAGLNDPTQTLAVGQAAAILAAGLTGQNIATANLAAANAVQNNRNFTQAELARIKDLSGGDPVLYQKLLAAGCADINCAAGLDPNSTLGQEMQALQDAGNQPALAADRSLLQQQTQSVTQPVTATLPLFDYTGWDKLNDTYGLTTRIAATGQTAYGATTGAAGIGLVTTGVASCAETGGAGCALAVGGGMVAAYGYDQSKAGITSLYTGYPSQTWGEQYLQSLGLSPTASALLYNAAPGLVAGGLSVGTALTQDATAAAAEGSALGGQAITESTINASATNTVATAGSAADMTTAAQLRTQLAFQQAGILDANGQLTSQAIQSSRIINLSGGGKINNPSIVQELTSDGSSISDWSKYTTRSISTHNGQTLQIHYYMNTSTGQIDYITPDFKVKGVVQP